MFICVEILIWSLTDWKPGHLSIHQSVNPVNRRKEEIMTVMMPLASSFNFDSMVQAGMMPTAMDIGEVMGQAQLSNVNTQLAITNMQNERIQATMKRSKQRDNEDDAKARMANINMALNDPDVDDASKERLRETKASLYEKLCGVEVNVTTA